MPEVVARNIPLLEVPATNPAHLAARYTSNNNATRRSSITLHSNGTSNGATTARNVNVDLESVPEATSAISSGSGSLTKIAKVIITLITLTVLITTISVAAVYFASSLNN
ncbi:unnamed protein product [Rotaria magnacalcarata]|uniref:Uncharacterized protein n=1 Tax=Rotaria magnacalcarata TaxID=392030 RepID=A0A820J390_9BILA|nr:unnamed protein product [Rotaria magnacalcarata]CAF4047293.1 unnamed protein product [Rotaria magnacalcarata]CAF4181926.1 unnamed protein product [Rotaria magnacalcarata]CAF4320696.1 unnamed protein product [Rotaria magnacalcarata]